MRIALASDIHLEFADLEIKNTDQADVLILAGDICIANDLYDHPEPDQPHSPEMLKILGSRQLKAHEYRQFFKRCSQEFPHVIVIAGNHEFYHGRWYKSLETLHDECAKFSNILFFEDNYKIIGEHLFVGATLWTDLARGNPLVIQSVQDGMNDYHVIRNDERGLFSKLRCGNSILRHRDSLRYFGQILANNKKKTSIVISHHAPSSMSIHPQYANSLLNHAYYSDLSNFILDNTNIKLWCHGHVHSAFDYKIGQCRVVCHPRGYVNHERGSQEHDPYYPMIIDI